MGHVLATLTLPEWLTAPDGRRVEDVPPAEFRRQALALGVDGIDASLGHTGVVSAYREHMTGVYDRAGRQGIANYFAAMEVLG
jgi:hypothetical protein